MNISTRLKSAYNALTANKSLYNSLGSVVRNYGKPAEFRPYAQVRGITYKAIDKIGMSASIYQPIVRRPNGEPYENHPLNVLYNRPNPKQSGVDFVHLWAMLYEIYGETFWYLARGESTRKVKEIYLLNPAQIELKIQDGELYGYILHKSNGQQVPFELDEIIHDKRPNPFNEWRGLSVLEKAATYIDTEINSASFTLNYISNSASPSGIVSLPNMEKEVFKQFAAQWREGYEGPENAGKTAFIRGEGVDFKAVGATLKDIDQKVTRDMAKEDVLMMLEVPKPLLGMTDDNGFGRANVEALYYIFSREKIEPMMKRLDLIYEKILQENNLGDQAKTVTHTSTIPNDKEYELSMYKEGVNRWLTPNDIREQMGLDPLPNGDTLPTKESQGQVTNTSPTKSVKRIVLKNTTKVDSVKKINEEQEAFRSKLVDTNEIYVTKLKRTITRFAGVQEKKVIDKISASSKAYEEWLPSVKEESEELAALLSPIVVDLMEAQSEDVANFISGELLTISPEMRRAVEINMLKISGMFNEDTLKALETTLVEGQTNGESLAKLKKRIEQVYSDAKGYRAERIARTESLKASNNTAELVYKENGYNKVAWFTNPGACEFCRTFSGKEKTIGKDFVEIGDVVTGSEGGQLRVEYSNIPTPPLHPNCTCSLIPVE